MLVGHSYGGLVISRAADLVPPGIIRSIVYSDALYVDSGRRGVDAMPGFEDVVRSRGGLCFGLYGDASVPPRHDTRYAGRNGARAGEGGARLAPRRRLPRATGCLTFRPVIGI